MSSSKHIPLIAALGLCLFVGFVLPRPRLFEFLFGSGDGYLASPSMMGDVDSMNGIHCDGLKVKVDFYGESLCPDCRHMAVDVLQPLFDNGISELMELRYVAYGNVRGNPEDASSLKCQHGEKECLYNRYINCAQDEEGGGSRDQNVWFPYIKCLAENLGGIDSRANSCAKEAGLSATKIEGCAHGERGRELEKEAGLETTSLVPKHTFVPWMVVNGVAIGSDYDNLDRYICAVAAPEKRCVLVYSIVSLGVECDLLYSSCLVYIGIYK